jgi:hypothetical protein
LCCHSGHKAAKITQLDAASYQLPVELAAVLATAAEKNVAK